MAGNLTSIKQKGTALLRCPSAPLIWLPQHSRRPAVIRSVTVHHPVAMVVPDRFLRKIDGSRAWGHQNDHKFRVCLTDLSVASHRCRRLHAPFHGVLDTHAAFRSRRGQMPVTRKTIRLRGQGWIAAITFREQRLGDRPVNRQGGIVPGDPELARRDRRSRCTCSRPAPSG